MFAQSSTLSRKSRVGVLAAILLVGMLGYWTGKLRADCGVLCVGLKCWVQFSDSKTYLIENDGVANWWFNATAGCATDKCDCAGKIELSFRNAPGSKVCDAIQTNQGEASNCKNPTGQFSKFNFCQGCTPKPKPSG